VIVQSALEPDVPSLTTVRALADGEPIEAMWVTVSFRSNFKNHFVSTHGPSDKRGLVAIERTAVIESAHRDLTMFPMDYGWIERSWTGEIEVEVMNREAIDRALNAVKTWGDLLSDSSPDLWEGLAAAAASLVVHDGSLLTVEVVATSGWASITPVASRA
jgi:hypothetical protein